MSFSAHLRHFAHTYVHTYVKSLHIYVKKLYIYVFFRTSTCFSSSCRRVFAAYLRTRLQNETSHLCAHVHIYVVFQVVVDVFFCTSTNKSTKKYYTSMCTGAHLQNGRRCEFSVHLCRFLHIYVILRIPTRIPTCIPT